VRGAFPVREAANRPACIEVSSMNFPEAFPRPGREPDREIALEKRERPVHLCSRINEAAATNAAEV
jgi:hypothetical protein